MFSLLASPAPIKAPIIVWVPLIGIENIDDTKITLNVARDAPNISFY